MSPRSPKRAKTEPEYELIYWPTIPGRGEPIRLVLEEAQASYKDVCNEQKDGVKVLQKYLGESYEDSPNVPAFAPPLLKHGEIIIGQLPNILLYLGSKLDLAGQTEADRYRINQLALTAFDWQNEAHDCHHPVAVMDYYENQKEEALRKANDFRKTRIPKFLQYFSRVLGSNQQGDGKFLVGTSLTYADLALFAVVDGVKFAFPNCMEKALEKFPSVKTHYDSVRARPKIHAYLESDRRKPFSNGIYRHYPELDD